jgi:tetratricopeptide (TPR) repeat protein
VLDRIFLKKIVVFTFHACLLFSACASGGRDLVKPAPVESRQSLTVGDFQKTIDVFKEHLQKNPRSKRLTTDFAKAVEEIKATADRVLGQKDYAQAGQIYRVLLSNYDDFNAFAEKLTFNKGILEVAVKNCRISLVDDQVRQDLKAGNYAKAIDAYPLAFKEYPGDETLAAKYLQTVQEVKAVGDKALAVKDFAQAGRIYRVLLVNYSNFKSLAAKLTFSKSVLEAAVRNCRISLVDDQARQYLKAGNYAKALAAYPGAFKEYLGDPAIKAKYLQTVREVKAAGDGALALKDFSRAGKVYALLLRSYPAFEGVKPGPPFGRPDLVEGLSLCRDRLTQAGLEEYRKRKLASAIAIWEDILAFDPDNAEIKKAVETARTQFKRIDKKKY